MNKWKILDIIICMGYYILSIICGMSIYLFLCLASFELFPTGFIHVFVNIGAVGLMFFTSVKVYIYFNHVYHDTKRGIKRMKLLKSKGLKSKIVKILSPEEDWIDVREKK